MADKKPICCLEGCNKKLKIIDLTITCRCGNQYCKNHRFAEFHNCSFDYRQEDQSKIEKMKCVASKMIEKV